MSHPLFGDTVTLYRKIRQDSRDSYTRHLLVGVQFRQKIDRELNGGIASLRTVTSITIPQNIGAGLMPGPMQGDVIVLGTGPEITAEYPITTLRREHPTYCTVQAVSDNTLRPHLRHWKVVAV